MSVGAAALIGGSSLLSGLAQTFQTNRTNQLNQKFALDMYNLNRRHTIEDWNRTNEFNSPKAQMQRFKDAGLSPHLIYGQMSNSPAIQTPQAPKFERQDPRIPNVGEAVSQGLDAYFSTQQRQADLDLTYQNMRNAKENEEFIKANTVKVMAEAGYKQQATQIANTMMPYNISYLQERERLGRAQTSKTLGDNERAWKMLPYDINKTLSIIARNKAQNETEPFKRNFLQQQANKIKELLPFDKLSRKQQNVLGTFLMESGAIKNALLYKQVDMKSLEKEMKALEIQLKRQGLSPTFTTDAIKGLIGIGALQQFKIPQQTPQRNPIGFRK